MKRKMTALFLTAGLLLSVIACGGKENDELKAVLVQEDEKEAYPTTVAEYGDVVKNVTIQCKYTSTEKQDMSFPVEGELIERVEVNEGDYVTEGQLLVTLDVEDLEEKIEDLEYQVSSLELKQRQTEEMKAFELSSAETIYFHTHMTQKEKDDLYEMQENINKQYQTPLEDIGDSLAIQRKRLEQYNEELEEGRLYAGITGEITYIQSGMEGTYCKKDKVVVTVSNLETCYFITEDLTYADFFKDGVSVFVNYANAGENYTCEVKPVLMENWNEKMYFKPVSDEIIASETGGKITMEYARKDNVLCIPSAAVHESDKGQFVYLQKDGLLEMRYVTVGLVGDNLTEIIDGLEQGEIVALKK